jgi:outer membrane scaffolding protein for murein synthesis (MipA/OmpV family)
MKRRILFSTLILSLAILASGWLSEANAQTPAPLANWQFSAGQVLESLEVTPPKWSATVGAGIATEPRYEGAKDYRILPSGILDIRYRDIAFLSDGEGLGVNLLHGKGYRAGVAIAYDLGRRQSVDSHLAGLGNISAAPVAKLFAEYFLKLVVLTADIRRGLAGNTGVIGDLGAYIPIPIIMDKIFMFLGPTVTFADNHYMQTAFGVTPAQSTASHLAIYVAAGGLYSAGAGMTIISLFGDHWFLNFDGGYQHLLGSSQHSPITETRTQFMADLNVGYRF